jgi:hypothetical protein
MRYVDEEGEFAFIAIPIVAYAPIWVPWAVTAAGAVGGYFAAKYYGESLGHYSEGDYPRGDEAIAKEMLTVEAVGIGVMGLMSVEGVGGGVNARESQKSLSARGKIDPNKIRFSQHDVSPMIRNKDRTRYPLKNLVKGLKDGTIKPDEIESVRIFERDGKLWTLDNRRVHAFREAGLDIPYRFATPEETAKEAAKKMTTTNQGISIKIR